MNDIERSAHRGRQAVRHHAELTGQNAADIEEGTAVVDLLANLMLASAEDAEGEPRSVRVFGEAAPDFSTALEMAGRHAQAELTVRGS